MKLEAFFEKFDLIADAPDAVAKMRELVLELAASGKLLPEALERPAEDDAKLMGTIVELVMGQAPAGDEYNIEGRGTVFVKVGEFGPLYPRKEVWTTSPLKFAKTGDVLVCVVGATVGKLNLAIDCAIGRSVAAIRPSSALETKFLYYSLIPYTLRLRRNSRGSAQGVIGRVELNAVSLWVPSRAVQKRIVAKVDELMALCDRLEADQKERETRKAALSRASLARFADAPTPANLELLFYPPPRLRASVRKAKGVSHKGAEAQSPSSFLVSPADLRKSILTLAVQGKLVPQDPNDEPAGELFARIATRRSASTSKQYAPVSTEEVPFEVPCSWQWVRLGNISLGSEAGKSPQCLPEPRTGTNWGVLKVSAVSWGIFKPDENKALPPGVPSWPDCEVRTGDFLLSRANTEDLVARSVVVDQAPACLMMSDKIIRFTFPDEIERAFINLANLSDPSRAYYARNASGTSSSMKNIGREVMCNLPIPLPPLAEQRRIVAKVDQLMALVDELEAQLAASRIAGEKLLTALIAELTNPDK